MCVVDFDMAMVSQISASFSTTTSSEAGNLQHRLQLDSWPIPAIVTTSGNVMDFELSDKQTIMTIARHSIWLYKAIPPRCVIRLAAPHPEKSVQRGLVSSLFSRTGYCGEARVPVADAENPHCGFQVRLWER